MVKHKGEKYLIPLSNVHNDDIKDKLDAKGLQHTECTMYRTLSNNFTEEEIKRMTGGSTVTPDRKSQSRSGAKKNNKLRNGKKK